MPKYYIIPMGDDFETTGRIRYRSVDVKSMKPAKEVPEITGTCVDTENLMKQAREGIKFYKVDNNL